MPLSFRVTRRAHALAVIIHTAELAAAQGDEAEATRRLQKAAQLAATPEKPTHVWVFDVNHRVYGEDRSRPIWRKHWRRHEIVGETTRSWITGRTNWERKIPKNPVLQDRRRIAWSEAEIDRMEWDNDNRGRIVRMIERGDLEQLETIARLIGYDVPPVG